MMKLCRIAVAILAILLFQLIAIATDTPIEAEVRESTVVQLPDRQITIQRVDSPKVPDSHRVHTEPQVLSPVEVDTVSKSLEMQQWLDQETKTTFLSISATVVDQRATFLRWRHEGAEYQAWSNANWMLLTGFSEYEKDDRRYVYILMASEVSSKNLPPESQLRVPDDLPIEPGIYQIIQGDVTHIEAHEGITALHELYRTDYARLKQAYADRAKQRVEREEALRANPPQPENVVLNFWKVERSEPNTQKSRKAAQ